MTIGTITYPTPVTVNGYQCKNCDQVDLAARHIDPAHPRSGAYDVDALSDPTRSSADKAQIAARRSAASKEVPAYAGDGSHGAAAVVLGLTIDRSA